MVVARQQEEILPVALEQVALVMPKVPAVETAVANLAVALVARMAGVVLLDPFLCSFLFLDYS
jgi:hypothetical protein